MSEQEELRPLGDVESASTFGVSRDELTGDLESLESVGGMDSLCAKLKTSKTHGIEDASLEGILSRKQAFGESRSLLPPPPEPSRAVLEALTSRCCIVLLVCTIASFVVNMIEDPEEGWGEGVMLFLASAVTFVFAFVRASRLAENSYMELLTSSGALEVASKSFSVTRAGETTSVAFEDLVVGDLVWLSAGDRVPCDCFVVEAENLECDESTITGNPDCVEHDGLHSPRLLSLTEVTRGSGTAIVTAVGSQSAGGYSLARSTGLRISGEPSKVEEIISRSTTAFLRFGGALLALVLLLRLVAWFINQPSPCSGSQTMCPDRTCVASPASCQACTGGPGYACWDPAVQALSSRFCRATPAACVTKPPSGIVFARPQHTSAGMYFVSMLVFVGAVSATLTTGFSVIAWTAMNKIKAGAALHCSVRRTSPLVFLPFVSRFYTDFSPPPDEPVRVATGWFAGRWWQPKNGTPSLPSAKSLPPLATEVLSACAIVQSELVGNKTIRAFVTMCKASLGTDTEGAAKQATEACLVKKFPFQGGAKMEGGLLDMRGAVAPLKPLEGCRVVVFGIPADVIGACTHSLDESGDAVEINARALHDKIDALTEEGLRFTCVAFRDFPPSELPSDMSTSTKEDVCKGLTLAAVLGLEDNVPTKDLAAGVSACRASGISVCILSVTSAASAERVGRETGILTSGECVTEADLAAIGASGEEQVVFTRNRAQISEVLDTAQRNGDVVAQGLRGLAAWTASPRPNISLSAMGSFGMLQQATDICVEHLSPKHLLDLVRIGRVASDNAQKFGQYVVPACATLLCTTLICATLGFSPPINTAMAMWAIPMMTSMAVSAFNADPARSGLMTEPPRNPLTSHFSASVWRYILLQVLLQTAAVLTVFFAGESMFALPRGASETCEVFKSNMEDCDSRDYTLTTLVFNTFVFCQIFSQIVARGGPSDANFFASLHRNVVLLVVLFVEVLVQCLLVFLTGPLVRTSPPSAGQFFATVGFAAVTFLPGLVRVWM